MGRAVEEDREAEDRQARVRTRPVAIALILALASCGEEGTPGYDALSRHVKNNRVGIDPDQWVEMRNLHGEWERTVLVFGYYGDHDECLKVIEGFKRANPAREYRCVPAN